MSILEIQNIHKSFGEHKVLNGVSLAVEKGEVIVLLGPSGSGKSTVLRCINGLEPISSGSIILDGETITAPNTKWNKIRQRMGMVFQSYELFSHKSIIENITLAPVVAQKRDIKEVTEQALKLLARVGLTEKQNAYPRQLSGGQKQRVAIIRALCMNPELMLLDEITAALDPEMTREVLDVILDLARDGMTMLIVTHEMAFAAAVADKIAFLDGGVINELSPAKEFFENPKCDRAKKFLDKFKF
ncbi:glutamine ABC transporter ATP-binding protein [Fibrobacterales bacterium]|nr:glutamine ABC transporter ATP-binding protein [Fibrobacterales bacterium]